MLPSALTPAECGCLVIRMSERPSDRPTDLPYAIADDVDDDELLRLIKSWRYAGPPTRWSAIVGHERQIERCRELVAMLQRSDEQLERLRIRVGRGMLISGPPGVGKTLLARATATATGRPVVTPPTSEMTPTLIARLYAQLAKMEPTVVILDEAEALIGQSWDRTTDGDCLRALLAAMDGINQPRQGPITLALTVKDPSQLEPAAIRPGRLAPRLVLEAPTPEERRTLLARAVEGLPIVGDLDLDVVVDRTGMWTGAELAGAVEEACARSLSDGTDALRQDLLLAIVAERHTIVDLAPRSAPLTRATAIHEASHAIVAELMWPGQVAVVELTFDGGVTRLVDSFSERSRDRAEIRQQMTMDLAGVVGEELILGSEHVGLDDAHDQARATTRALSLFAQLHGYSPEVLEGPCGTGAERMRAEVHAWVASAVDEARRAAAVALIPRTAAIEQLADRLLAHPDKALAGADLRNALRPADSASV